MSNEGLGLLLHRVRSGELERDAFLVSATALGIEAAEAARLADGALAVHQNQHRLRGELPERFDYVIAGAGSGGCVLAARLSENPDNRVLLIEAGGPDAHPDVYDPTRWPHLLPRDGLRPRAG